VFTADDKQFKAQIGRAEDWLSNTDKYIRLRKEF